MDAARATASVRTETGKGGNVARRFWTTKEEECLLIALEVLYAEGVKLDGSLRNACMIRLANMIGEMLPGCGIEPKHVKSKCAVWRRTHTAIVTILGASGGAGFTFDSVNHMIVQDKPDAWADQERVYKEGVKLVRGKAFPWLDKWNILFGADRATGNGAIDVGDASTDLCKPSNQAAGSRGKGLHDSNTPRTKIHIDLDDEGDEATSITPPSVDGVESRKSSSKRRRSSHIDASQIKDLMNELMETAQVTLSTSTGQFAPASSNIPVTPVNDIAVKQDGIYDALVSLEDLTTEEIMWAAHHLPNNHGDLRAFYGMPLDVRSTFVRSLKHFIN